MRSNRLIVTAGLPGSGKSTIAEELAQRLGAPVLSVDPIEAAMWRSGIPVTMTGIAAYAVAEAIAAENLGLGLSVVVDAVNPVQAARTAWKQLAEQKGALLTFVECTCSDPTAHRTRVEARIRGIVGMPEITWDQVEVRRGEYEPFIEERIVLDTAYASPEMLVQGLLSQLRAK